MPEQIPVCVNYIKKRGCSRSDVRITNETDEAWVFMCHTCKCVQVISKDGVRDRSNFENALRRKREQEELERARARRKVFV